MPHFVKIYKSFVFDAPHLWNELPLTISLQQPHFHSFHYLEALKRGFKEGSSNVYTYNDDIPFNTKC